MSHQPQQQQQTHQQSNPVIDVAQQLGNKQAPTNEQISHLIDTTQQFVEKKKQDPRVDKQALKTVSDFQGVLEATKQLNENKNYDEALQSAVMETGKAAKETGQKAKHKTREGDFAGGASMEQQKEKGRMLKEQGKQLTEVVWEVLKEMARSGEFRSQVSTLLGVLQEMLAMPKEEPTRQGGIPPAQQHHAITPQDVEKQKPATGYSAVLAATAPPPESLSQPWTGDESFGGTQTGTQSGTQTWNKLSEEKKHEISFNFLSILRKFNQRPEFKEGLQNIVQMFRELGNQSGLGKQDAQRMWNETVTSNPHAQEAFNNSKKLIERFTGSSLDTFLVKNRELFHFMKSHEQIRGWWDSFVQLLNDSFQKPQQLDEYEFTRRIETLVDEANQISQQPEFKGRYVAVMSELRYMVSSIKDDPDLRNLQEKTMNFLDNFTYTDDQGNKRFNTDLIQQLRQFVVPLLIAQLENIPIPPIQGSNPDYDYYFDNMVLHGQEIFPDMIEMHTRSDASINVKDLSAEQMRNRAEISVSNIKFKISDIHFKFDRKTFPKLSDEGLATVRVEGDSGVSLRILLDFFMKDNTPHARLSDVSFDIEKLKIDIQEAKHDFLLKIFAAIYQTRTKKMIEDSTEKKIRDIFQKLEEGINNLFARYPPSKLKEMAEQKADQAFSSNQSKQSWTQGERQQGTTAFQS